MSNLTELKSLWEGIKGQVETGSGLHEAEHVAALKTSELLAQFHTAIFELRNLKNDKIVDKLAELYIAVPGMEAEFAAMVNLAKKQIEIYGDEIDKRIKIPSAKRAPFISSDGWD